MCVCVRARARTRTRVSVCVSRPDPALRETTPCSTEAANQANVNFMHTHPRARILAVTLFPGHQTQSDTGLHGAVVATVSTHSGTKHISFVCGSLWDTKMTRGETGNTIRIVGVRVGLSW